MGGEHTMQDHYCIAGTLGTPFSLQEKPSETEYLYQCTIIGTIQTHTSQIQMQAILLLKIHGRTQPLGEKGGSYAYVVNTSELIVHDLVLRRRAHQPQNSHWELNLALSHVPNLPLVIAHSSTFHVL